MRGLGVAGVIRHGGHQDGAIAKQPVRPDEFQQRIGQKGHHQGDAQLQPCRVAGQCQIARQRPQHCRIADQGNAAANRDHRGRGEKGGALAQAVDHRGIKDARLAGDEFCHPVMAVAFHQLGD